MSQQEAGETEKAIIGIFIIGLLMVAFVSVGLFIEFRFVIHTIRWGLPW